MLTISVLVAAGVHPTQARLMLDPLSEAVQRFHIDNERRTAAFLGQVVVESRGLSVLEENCYWTTPERIQRFFPSRVHSLDKAMSLVRNPKALANCVYAEKNGNGDEASGDGWKYRGRGLIQLTGRNNYHDAGIEVGERYLEDPDLVSQPVDACLSSAWFWNANKLNILADAWNIDAITRAVNGPAMAEKDLRRQHSDEALMALH